MIYFLGTSALVKLYPTERGSVRIRRLLQRKEHVFYQSFLTRLEVASALYRRLRSNDISSDELSLLLRAHVTHCHQDYLLLPYSDALCDRASALAFLSELSDGCC